MKVNSITKKEKEEEKIKIKFPLIAKSKHNGSVVIFVGHGRCCYNRIPISERGREVRRSSELQG